MIKSGLTVDALKSYVPLIQEETLAYFKDFKDKGEFNLFQSLSELIIMTASRCLMGKEVRSKLDASVADLYHDLDGGFTPLNFLFPNLPLPSYRRRDEAHVKMRELFLSIMNERRQNNDLNDKDILQALMDSRYKNGEKVRNVFNHQKSVSS